VCATIFPDDVSDDDSIDDGTEYDGDYVEPREDDSECVQQATSDDYGCNKMAATDSFSLERRGRSGARQRDSTQFRRK
jgi:hypothetical protein